MTDSATLSSWDAAIVALLATALDVTKLAQARGSSCPSEPQAQARGVFTGRKRWSLDRSLTRGLYTVRSLCTGGVFSPVACARGSDRCPTSVTRLLPVTYDKHAYASEYCLTSHKQVGYIEPRSFGVHDRHRRRSTYDLISTSNKGRKAPHNDHGEILAKRCVGAGCSASGCSEHWERA